LAVERRLVEPQPAERRGITRSGMVGDQEGEAAPGGIDDREGRRIARPEQIARPKQIARIRLRSRAGGHGRISANRRAGQGGPGA